MQGHQAADGSFLAEGNYIDGALNTDDFLERINSRVISILKIINDEVDSDRNERRQCATKLHRTILKSFKDTSFWKKSFTSEWIDLFNARFGHISGARLTIRASVCFACLFERPECTLPCGHVICFNCIREFDQSPTEAKYPGVAVHHCCVLCGLGDEKEGTWPHISEYRPDLSGIRAISLDGGGVRGIIQLTVIQRLVKLINLDIAFVDLFDLMVGTSAGKS